MSFNVAFIGCGLIAREHAECIRQIEGLEFYAYCDTDLAQAELMLGLYGGRYATDASSRIFADDDIDVVYICTRHDSHTALTIAACNAGKHVMLEKPMALTLEECYAIGDAVERTRVQLMCGFKLRFYPSVSRAMEWISTPILSTAHVLDNRWGDDTWMHNRLTGGGNVLSQGCHAMDLLCYLNRSEPVRIYAEGGTYTHRDPEVVDNMVATIRFASGSIATISLGDSGLTPFVSKFSFQMVDGTRTAHIHDRLKTTTLYDGTETQTISDSEERGMMGENQAFLAALKEGGMPIPGYKEGIRATAMVLAAFKTLRTGQPQDLPGFM